MTFLDDIGNTFKSVGEATGKGFKDGFNDVGDGFQSFGESVGEISSKIPGFLKKLEKGTIHEIKDALNKMTDTDLEDVTVIKGIEVEATRKVTLKEVE